MDQQVELEVYLGEAKAEIIALKKSIPMVIIFNKLSNVFRSNIIGYWLSNVVLLHLLLIGPGVLIGLALNELEKLAPVFLYVIILTVVVVAGIVVVHIAVQFIFDDLVNQIIGKINNVGDLARFNLWLKQTWSAQNVSAFAIANCGWGILLMTGGFSVFIHQFVGFGFLLWSAITGLLVGIGWYGLVWVGLLALNLKEYQYEMNAFSPADSEILTTIFEMFMRCIYIMATYMAVVTLVFTSGLIEQQVRTLIGLPILAVCWTLIILQFVLARSALSAITSRAKWATLNRIRAKINSLEATSDLSDKETAERFFRLADIHKQIKASKTNTLDLASITTLFSQLMLPLLGLLLGNIDTVMKLINP